MQKIVVTRLDDLDGSEATETVSFGLGEQGNYEIDLSAANAERLRKTFAPLITAGRPVRAARPKRTRQPSAGTPPVRAARNGQPKNGQPGPVRDMSGQPKRAQIRVWAVAHGHEIKARGRISQSVIDEYRKAHA
jgi:hypothetical protein